MFTVCFPIRIAEIIDKQEEVTKSALFPCVA